MPPSCIVSLKTERSQPYLLHLNVQFGISFFVSEPMKGKNCLIKGSTQSGDLRLEELLSDTSKFPKKGLNTRK